MKWLFGSYSDSDNSGGKTFFWPSTNVIDNNYQPDIIFESRPTMKPDERLNKTGLYIFLTPQQVNILVHLQTFFPIDI